MARASRRDRGKSRALSVLDERTPITYDEERLYWRRNLSDDIVRALAADYLRGYKDECNQDAFHEYERRFGSHSRQSIAATRASKRARYRR